MRTHTVVDSPLGPLLVVAQDDALVQLGPLAADDAAPTTSAWGPALDVERVGERDDDLLPQLRAELDAYWSGTLRDFTVPVAPPGTPFQQRVWAALRTIPYGETWSYAQLADRIGSPTAVRAVGAANGRNPVFLVVPCHRVIGSSGKLVGYAGGLDRKRWLLDHERAAAWVASR